jgi:hypothetical protein
MNLYDWACNSKPYVGACNSKLKGSWRENGIPE